MTRFLDQSSSNGAIVQAHPPAPCHGTDGLHRSRLRIQLPAPVSAPATTTVVPAAVTAAVATATATGVPPAATITVNQLWPVPESASVHQRVAPAESQSRLVCQ